MEFQAIFNICLSLVRLPCTDKRTLLDEGITRDIALPTSQIFNFALIRIEGAVTPTIQLSITLFGSVGFLSNGRNMSHSNYPILIGATYGLLENVLLFVLLLDLG
jgi:hypothetical protein